MENAKMIITINKEDYDKFALENIEKIVIGKEVVKQSIKMKIR